MAGTRRVVAWLKTISRSTVQFWKGELDVTTLRSVPSWGVSFLLHALLLLDLGLHHSGQARAGAARDVLRELARRYRAR